jgi:hypothetical protein
LELPEAERFHQAFGGRRTPALFEGGARSWPAFQRWSLDFFERDLGAATVPVSTGLYVAGAVPGTADRLGESVEMTLSGYVQQLRRGGAREPRYLAGPETFQRQPALLQDLRFPSYPPLERFSERSFWMGPPGTVTHLHMDRAQNLYAQFVGRKRWLLFSPEKSPAMQPLRIHWAASLCGHELGEDALGLLARRGITPDHDFEVGPGDVLFLPYGWWHRVETVEISVAANAWWWTLPMVLQRGPEVALASLWAGARAARHRVRAA